MDLEDVRTKFVQLSGRYDLVADAANDDYSDNGADFYITEGQKFLERLVTVPENTANIYEGISSGSYYLTFQHSCRAIHSVWCEDDEERWELEKVSIYKMKENYNEPIADITTGEPTYYCLANLRGLETTDQNSLATYLDYTHSEGDTKYDYRGILFAPPADGNYVLSISGLFLQVELSNDADENFWTLEAPSALIKAAMYQLDVLTKKGKSEYWLKALMSELDGIEKDAVSEEVARINQIRG